MKYFILEPEVAGHISESEGDWSVHPPQIQKLHYEFEGWVGGELLTAFPCFLVTTPLKEDLERLGASGMEFDSVVVSTSETFEELKEEGFLSGISPGQQLPQFHWLKITGEAGKDDCGQTGIEHGYSLVVAEPVLSVMQNHNLSLCSIEKYVG